MSQGGPVLRRSSRIPVPNVRLTGTNAEGLLVQGVGVHGDDEEHVDQLRAGAELVVEQLRVASLNEVNVERENGGGDGEENDFNKPESNKVQIQVVWDIVGWSQGLRRKERAECSTTESPASLSWSI